MPLNFIQHIRQCLGGAPPSYYERVFGKQEHAVSKIRHATLSLGEVFGVELPCGTTSFRGIPFAKARRCEPPMAVAPWKPALDCTRYGPALPQGALGARMLFVPLTKVVRESCFPPLAAGLSYTFGRSDEADCLNLNVWTPWKSDEGSDKKRAVLVWIHGGKFTMGSNMECGIYDGSRLASRGDVVVVTLNYRFGAFAMNIPGEKQNLSLRDMIAGLQWVQREIGALGGDPSNVTLMGESAGGIAVLNLLASPLTKGLFHKAVSSSGMALSLTTEYRDQVNEAARKSLGVASITKEAIQNASVKALIKAGGKMDGCMPKGMPGCGPVRDGDVVDMDGALMALKKGVNRSVPLLIGHNSDELAILHLMTGTFIAEKLFAKPMMAAETLKIVDCAYNYTSAKTADVRAADALANVQRLLAASHDGTPPPGLVGRKAAESASDSLEVGAAEAHRQAGGTSYVYEFSAPCPRLPGLSYHGLDLSYLWPCLQNVDAAWYAKSMGYATPFSQELLAFADNWQDVHIAFAKSGSPASLGGTQWETFPKRMKASATGSKLDDAVSPGVKALRDNEIVPTTI